MRHSFGSSNKENIFENRMFFFVGMVVLVFALLIVVIAYTQIFNYLNYSKISASNRRKIERIAPIRGKIFSSDGKIIANNITIFNITINTRELFKDNVLRQKELIFLSKIINYEYEDLEKILYINQKNKKSVVTIDKNVSFNTVIQIKENSNLLPGVEIKEIPVRRYPNKDALSHVIGYTAPIDQDDYAILKKKGYQQNDRVGKSGIERYYEEYLRGVAGRKVYSIDAKMTKKKEIISKRKDPLPGKELVLTINIELQKNIEDILADRLGSILVLKPSTGEILAMASYPDFDPNIYILQNEENDIKKREIALNTSENPLINRNIQAIYPPASIFKLVSSTAILNEDIVSATKSYFCSGRYRLNTKYYKCWVYPNQHGWENLEGAIKDSCDIYFYNVSQKIGITKIHDYAVKYGFGNYLGIDLPSEKSGLIPSIKWMESKGERWVLGLTLISAIGQGDVKVTPLQIGNFLSVICNKGYSYRPHILKEIRSGTTGKVEKEIKPEKIIDLQYPEYVFAYLKRALRKVVTEGTARGAFYTNTLKIAGKTGTAEIGTGITKSTHSWFVGFGPIDYPPDEQIVVVVLLEYENGSYYRFAAPIASMVFNSWFRKENYIETAKRLRYPIKDSYRDL